MRWFVLRVKNREAYKIALKIGLSHCWLPTIKRWTKPARKHQPVEVEINLIPGWLFVQEDQHGRWADLDGVYGTLKYGKQGTLWIEDEELDGLREACNPVVDSVERQPDAILPVFLVGHQVKLKGLLQGRFGRVLAVLGRDLYRVEVESLRIEIHAQMLEGVED